MSEGQRAGWQPSASPVSLSIPSSSSPPALRPPTPPTQPPASISPAARMLETMLTSGETARWVHWAGCCRPAMARCAWPLSSSLALAPLARVVGASSAWCRPHRRRPAELGDNGLGAAAAIGGACRQCRLLVWGYGWQSGWARQLLLYVGQALCVLYLLEGARSRIGRREGAPWGMPLRERVCVRVSAKRRPAGLMTIIALLSPALQRPRWQRYSEQG